MEVTVVGENEYESGEMSNTHILDSSDAHKLTTIEEEESSYLDSSR